MKNQDQSYEEFWATLTELESACNRAIHKGYDWYGLSEIMDNMNNVERPPEPTPSIMTADPECGIKEGEIMAQAAEGWAIWCEYRGNQMLANFLRKIVDQNHLI